MSDSKKCEKQKDEEIVRLALDNPDFYACIVERYEEKLTRYIRRISSASDDDIQDILQDVFIKAYKNLNDFD